MFRRGTTVLNDRRERLAQAMAMMTRRVQGASTRTLQSEFNLSRATVARRLRLARQLGMVEDFQTVLMDRLLPLAAAVMEAELLNGNAKVASDLLYGVGVLRKNPAEAVQRPPADDGLSMQTYRLRRRRTRSGD